MSTFGVDIVMSSGSDMFGKRTGLLINIHLNLVNAAVAHIGKRKIDDTVSSEEGHGTDRTVRLQSFYPDVVSGQVDDS